MESLKDEALWEESVVLAEASGQEEAIAKGQVLGKKREVSFQAASGEAVEWKFIKAKDAFEILDELPKDGAEVFARFVRFSPLSPPTNGVTMPQTGA